ncbi:MAG TPA: 50S ribosomal protein L4 [Desulfobacterales bacterium]
MPTIDVLNRTGKKVSQRELSDAVFSVTPKRSVLHEVVTAQLAVRRAGTASSKQRGEVSGSTRKLFRQKGTGRARRGNIKSPLLRGGGVTFGPKPRSYSYQPPKKLRKLALRMALTSKLQENQLVVLDGFDLDEIKTKAFLEVFRALNIENALIVTEKKDEKLELSSRNVPNVKVMRSEGLNVYDVLKHRFLVLLEPAINQIEGRLSA